MIEVNPDDIALLNDTDLRTLVRLLCECELKVQGHSASYVTAGGAQDAADGGVDVRVALPAGTQIDGFIPRAATVFQSKDTDMQPAKILAEMRPKGTARPSIQELARIGGAYIIATSGNVTDSMLEDRLAAMKEAVNDVENRDALHLDFYDRTRLASWVNSHASLILWIREKIGKPLTGWRAYGAWAYPAEGVDAEYLVDDQLRVVTQKVEDGEGLAAAAGIEHIRAILDQPAKVVRLVGLSGVGKTRFVQALFDSRIGKNSLSPALAMYTNTSDNPNPQPRNLAAEFVASGNRAILVVDNCTRELHASVSDACRAQGSKVSLLTIEHDVRDDMPEETDVFWLEPSSPDLIEDLVKHRYPDMSPVTVRTIAANSDGNARIAIALAGTVGKNETISALPDEAFFQRLFQQGHGSDDSLLLAAQAMSLVYSFHGENISDDKDAELVRLGGMVGKNAQDIYRYTAMLRERDLVQHRGPWRALLPHALANRLAKSALRNIPPGVIEAHLVTGAPVRLLRSFSRRLGYLSDSPEAVAIATKWLAPGGMLAELTKLSFQEQEMLQNVAPVAPQAALAAIERVLLGPEAHAAASACRYVTRILRPLAYDPAMFERCAELFAIIADIEPDGTNAHDAARNMFPSLFSLYASGTHATVQQRLAVLRTMLLSSDAKRRSLGLKGLGFALEGMHFGAGYDFEFGSRVRDHGYWPKTRTEVKQWYAAVLNFVAELAVSNAAVAPEVRKEIANRFRGLWTGAAVYDELESACGAIQGSGFWQEGWIAARETQEYDAKGLRPEIAERLSLLEQFLRPKDLRQKVLAIVLGDERHCYDLVVIDDEELDDTNEDASSKKIEKKIKATNDMVRNLGQAVAANQEVFEQLLPQLFTGSAHQGIFGEGLADGSQDLQAMWDRLRGQVKELKGGINFAVMCGFLNAVHLSNPQLAHDFLEKSVEDDILGAYHPILEASFNLDERGAKRILRALAQGRAAIHTYKALCYGGVSKTIPSKAMKDIVQEIATKDDGFHVAIEVLYMRLHDEKQPPEEIQEAGRALLERIPFVEKDQHADYRYSKIAKACLSGPGGAAFVTQLCGRLKQAILAHKTHIMYYDDLLGALMHVQPKAVLDAMSAGDEIQLEKGLYLDLSRVKAKVFTAAPESALLEWCEEKPATRYATLASAVPITANDEDAKDREWFPLALRLLDKAPDRVEVLKRFVSQMKSATRAAHVEANSRLLAKLAGYADPAVAALVAQETLVFAEQIKELKQSESVSDRSESDRFE
jgi:hypothetical protein